MNMSDYIIGRVYKIQHKELDICYIGSTFRSLKHRIKEHKTNYDTVLCKYIQEYGIDNFTISLIKEYECVDRRHLHSKEQLYINSIKCINKASAIQFLYYKEREKEHKKDWYENNKEKHTERMKEYNETNKEKLKEYHKKYYETNKEKTKEKNKEKIICECGSTVVKKCIARHKKSNKHLRLMEHKQQQ